MRGSVIGEKVVGRAQTKEWDEGCDRAGIGEPKKGEGGTWVWDPAQGKLVRPWEKGVAEEQRALDAPVIVGRQYENVPSPIDGHVFTGRTDYNRYMKEHGLTHASDYDKPGGYWERAAKKREEGFASPEQKKARQEIIGRRLYEVEKMKQSVYDRQVEMDRRKRLERHERNPDPLIAPTRK